jgi:hypothetical protein
MADMMPSPNSSLMSALMASPGSTMAAAAAAAAAAAVEGAAAEAAAATTAKPRWGQAQGVARMGLAGAIELHLQSVLLP